MLCTGSVHYDMAADGRWLCRCHLDQVVTYLLPAAVISVSAEELLSHCSTYESQHHAA